MKNSVLLIITGSVAAYKALELIRLLKEKNIGVTCVLTKGAKKFVTPLSCAALSGNPVYDDLFSLKDETEMGHIRLSRASDLVVVAPASADILAKMANGLADDLATTLLLATDKPVIAVPAMNVKMWEHPATQRNVKQLKSDGVAFIGPERGDLACGEEGFGRMAEADMVASAIEKALAVKTASGPLSGHKALVTSGPTVEPIDPVRFITNRSSGKQGYAIASALAALGAEVTLVSGPTQLPDPGGVRTVHVQSAQEMLEACERALPADIAVCAAAVADWRAAEISPHKIKKLGAKAKKKGAGDNFTFTFTENPDILLALARHARHRPRLVIGFAAETEHVIENAKVKLEQKHCDWIIANDVSGGVFGDDENKVHLVTRQAVENWPRLSKSEVAARLAAGIADMMTDRRKLCQLAH